MTRFDKEYKEIDNLCQTLEEEFKIPFKEITPPKPPKDLISDKIQEHKTLIKRKLKAQMKEEQKMIQYINDRLVIMQIESQSQPSSRIQNAISWEMIEISTPQKWKKKVKVTKHILWSPWSNSAEMYHRPAKQHQLVERVRRHVAKRPKAVFDYDKFIIEKDDKRVRRNKRLRQTYFEASHKSSKPSSATKAQTNKIQKKKYMNMTIDMFFPIKEMDENSEELKQSE